MERNERAADGTLAPGGPENADGRRYLNAEEAAAYLGLSGKTLARMRIEGSGPRYSKARRRVIYDVGELDVWVERRKRRFTGEEAGED